MKITAIRRSGINGLLKQATFDAGVPHNDSRTTQSSNQSKTPSQPHREIVLPAQYDQTDVMNAYRNPQVLWKAANHHEQASTKGKQEPVVGRRLTSALPGVLDRREQVDLARRFAGKLTDHYQNAIDFTISERVRRNGKSVAYVSFVATTSVVTPEGFAEKTSMEHRQNSSRHPGIKFREALKIRNLWSNMRYYAVADQEVRQRAVQNYNQRQGKSTAVQGGAEKNSGRGTGPDGAKDNSL